jgi:chromosome segregation ATPase
VNEQKKELIAVQEQHAQDMAGALERERQLQRQNSEIQKQLEDDSARLADVIAERDEAKKAATDSLGLYNDALQKLSNASDQVLELQLEVERLNSELRDMRAAQAFGEKQAQKVIDITPDSVTDVQDLVNQVAKIFKTSKSIGGNWHEVTYDDNTKEVVHSSELEELQKAGAPFRPEEQVSQPVVPTPEIPALEVQFPTLPSLPSTTIGLATEQPGIPATWEDRLKALEQRVAALEQK